MLWPFYVIRSSDFGQDDAAEPRPTPPSEVTAAPGDTAWQHPPITAVRPTEITVTGPPSSSRQRQGKGLRRSGRSPLPSEFSEPAPIFPTEITVTGPRQRQGKGLKTRHRSNRGVQ